MGTTNHDETTGPDKTPNPQEKNTAVPDSEANESAPIPFGDNDQDQEQDQD